MLPANDAASASCLSVSGRVVLALCAVLCMMMYDDGLRALAAVTSMYVKRLHWQLPRQPDQAQCVTPAGAAYLNAARRSSQCCTKKHFLDACWFIKSTGKRPAHVVDVQVSSTAVLVVPTYIEDAVAYLGCD